MPENHTRSRSLLRAALSVALIALFCFVPARLLYQNIDGSAGRQPLQDPVALSAPSNGTYGSPVQLYPADGSEVCVVFEFLGFDPATSLANFGVVVDATSLGAAVISPLRSKAGSGYTPLLRISSNSGLSTITIPVPASALLASDTSTPCSQRAGQPYPGDGGYRVLQDIFMLGQPRAFPNDWYELDDTVAVYMCPPKHSQDECAAGVNNNGNAHVSSVPLKETLIATTRNQDLTMTVATGVPGRFQFTIQRPASFVVYTYWVATMPFVLMLGLFGAYAWRKRNYVPERKIPAVYEIAFGVAAALVAILPLRAVLVPSSLPTLTRLDIVFSTGVTLLVALSLAWVFIWASVQRQPTPDDAAP